MQTLGLDIKSLASRRGAHLPKHPLLPPPILALTRHWLKLNGGKPPAWSQFHMMDVAEAVPYMTVLRCAEDPPFTFTFTGSAVSALLGEDLTGRAVSRDEAVLGELDWSKRCRPAAELVDIHATTGRVNPPYTSAIDYVAADLPFMDDAGTRVSHIVGVTVAKLN